MFMNFQMTHPLFVIAYITCKWQGLCIVNCSARKNVFAHKSHWKGFDPVWICLCQLKWLECLKSFPQKTHLKGLSPVRIRLWLLKAPKCKKCIKFVYFILRLLERMLGVNFYWKFDNWGLGNDTIKEDVDQVWPSLWNRSLDQVWLPSCEKAP